MAHLTYSPKDVVCAWNAIPITGFASDTFITLRRNEDVVTEYVGADGTLMLTKNANMTGEVEISLAQTAKSNHFLAAASFAAEKAGAAVPISDFTIVDPSGLSVLAVAVNAYLKTLPENVLAKDGGDKTWVFGCEKLIVSDDLAGALAAVGDFIVKGEELLSSL